MTAATHDKPETRSGYNANSEENTDPQTHGSKAGTGRATGDTSSHDISKAQQRGRERDNSPRGAGSGEDAVRLRQLPPRKPIPPRVKTTEYEKGDIDKGRIDPKAQAEGIVADIIPMRDRRAYLIDQAEKNEAANDELNAIQVEQNRQVQFAQNQLQDPDVQRENSMETAIAALKAHGRGIGDDDDPNDPRDPAVMARQKEFREAHFAAITGQETPK